MIAGSLSSCISWFSVILKVLTIIRPERSCVAQSGFRCYWRWKSPHREATEDRHGAARVDPADERRKPLWGAPRIHGELFKLGFEVAQSRAPSTWSNDEGHPARARALFCAIIRRNRAMDLFVVPTIGFDCSMPFVIVRLDRRDLVWINVTTNPTADWIARH